MKTDDLIKALSTDVRPAMPMTLAWWIAAALGAAVAASVFVMTIGPRPDIADAMHTVRFPFKFVVTVALAVTAFRLAGVLSRPGADFGLMWPWLLLAPALLGVAIAAEMFFVPGDQLAARLVGTNWAVCLALIPLIGIGPLAIFLAALRHGAPTRPALAGAVAGLAAGGLAATFYAAHCTDDSPLFVAAWYTIAVAILALLGALIAPRVTRW
ncbi:NrsF family protein [Rhizobiaceae sp. 2RAB30]